MCISCKRLFSDELIDISDEQYCSDCFGKSFTQCVSCQEVVETKDTKQLKGKDWCHACLSRNTSGSFINNQILKIGLADEKIKLWRKNS